MYLKGKWKISGKLANLLSLFGFLVRSNYPRERSESSWEHSPFFPFCLVETLYPPL
jgi:hypothetical protein